MQVDFYQLTRDPVERLAALIAQRTLAAGERLLVIAAEAKRRRDLSEALWGASDFAFLANGMQDDPDPALQPVLISETPDPANGARYMLLADGGWIDAETPFERVFLPFEPHATQGAREAWRALASRAGIACRYWKQQDGKWVEGP